MSKASKPTSEKRLAANRANAARSTGPRTSGGKSRSARNALKHGFATANFTVIKAEEIAELANIRADLIHVHQPVNSQELFALERMALAQLSILRAARLETGFLTACLQEAVAPETGEPVFIDPQMMADIEITAGQRHSFGFAAGFHRLTRRSDAFSLLLRYQAQAERQYRRAREEFNSLKALRPELPNDLPHDLPIDLPNEPIPATNPLETQPLSKPARTTSTTLPETIRKIDTLRLPTPNACYPLDEEAAKANTNAVRERD
jgi:hypothetical protein